MTDRPAVASSELNQLLDAYVEIHGPDGRPVLVEAYELAKGAHHGQFRRTGEPYVTHPLAVAQILADYGLDRDTLVAALLHDTVEDTDITLEQLRGQFGDTVASLIDGVTKLDRIKFATREEAQAATIRKMVIAMAQDVRVLLIKLADRLHNVRTLAPLPEEKRRRVASETIEVYAPLAHRLGVQEIKHEMENRCFEVLFPGRYAEITDLIEQRAPQRERIIEKAIGEVSSMLADAGISGDVSARPKHHYSIYRKMVESGHAFESIHDLIGIRIITKDVRDCYAALGFIHSAWPPVHGRFKDYIAMPKFNLYQSLHTTVIGPEGKPLEVQIRSEEMHHRAEAGIASHWRYKEQHVESGDLPWMADLRRIQEEHTDPTDFLTQLKLDLYQDEVFVVTPAGDVVTLPAGSTPVDFAYTVHTEVGHSCSGARVNGRLVPLESILESGDIVEIVRGGRNGPSRDWLSFVRTSRAKAKIRQWFSKERREVALADGRSTIAGLIRREGLGLKPSEKEDLLAVVAQELGFPSVDGMLIAVGERGIGGPVVINRLARLVRGPDLPDDEPDLLAPPRTPKSLRRAGTGVIVEGLDDVLVGIARCCAPVPGDDIVGFVTVGRGVSVHRSDCTNVSSLGDQPDRMIDVNWAPERIGTFAIWVQVESLDRSGLLRDVSAAITDVGGNIVASSSASGRDRVAILRYAVELSDPSQVGNLISQLQGVDGVYEAFRIQGAPAEL